MKQIVEALDVATGEVVHREIASGKRAATLREIEEIRAGRLVLSVTVRPIERNENPTLLFGKSKFINAAVRQIEDQG